MRARASWLILFSLSLATPLRAQDPAPTANAIVPGGRWLDTQGNLIQAHGGGILQEGFTYYWYGENRGKLPGESTPPRVRCYSSKDLIHWTHCANGGLASQPDGELGPGRVLERPKVIRCPQTGKYVMYMHIDSGNYREAKVGVAVSTQPDGAFRYLGSYQPFKHQSRDMTLFQDTDGAGYVVFEDRESGVRIVRLTDNYLGAQSETALVHKSLEAPAIVKVKGVYFLLGSSLSGWDPNPNHYATANSLAGPWSDFKDVAPPDTRTYRSQTSFILPVTGSEKTAYIYGGDRWLKNDLPHSPYLWMPLQIDPVKRTMHLAPDKPWTINTTTGAVTGSETTH